MIPGLRIYCDSYDIARANQQRTIDLALRAGAVGVIAMVEGITGDRGSRRVALDVVQRFADRAQAHALHVTACAFPDVREDHAPSIAHLRACVEIADEIEVDVEPRAGVHWTPTRLRPWLAPVARQRAPMRLVVPSITTTRHEALRLGKHGHYVRGQLEQLESTNTLEHALERLSRGTRLELVEPVIGAFDQRGVVRTPAHVRRDLERCTPQARLAGGLAVWSAHTLDDEEADVLREWALATWRRAA